jgi:hypothetical protein
MVADTPEDRVRALVELLERVLADFDAGRSELSRLVRDVESVIDSLVTFADAGWVTELRGLWGELEIVYAVMLDEGRKVLTDDERRDVAETVTALRRLLQR